MTISKSQLLDALERITRNRAAELRAAAAFVETAINQHVDRLGAELAEKDAVLNELERSALLQQFQGEAQSVQGTFAQSLRSSLFVSAWSNLEVDLTGVADCLAIHRAIDLSVTDLSGRGVNRAKHFFCKVLRVPFPVDEPCNDLMLLNRLRDRVVHNDRRISDDRALANYLAQTGNVSIEKGKAVFHAGFVPEALSAISAFWTELFYGLRQ